ncbi:MAG: hypothetical protein K2Q10_03865 [Rhodospirillales bacterium]|nr:hypothetical protein [Rhodospirillales bacterium]
MLAGLILALAPFAAHAAEGGQPARERVIPRAGITDKDCLDCHGNAGFAVPTGQHGDTVKKPLHVEAESFTASVHGKLQCLSCHTDIDKLPHKKDGLQSVDCVGCHRSLHKESDELLREVDASRALVGLVPARATPAPPNLRTGQYLTSVHAAPRKEEGTRRNAECRDCHGSHYVFKSSVSESLTNRLNSPAACGSCHPKQLDQYRGSVHGAALLTPWKGKSATCTDCHSAHTISEAKSLTARHLVTTSCGTCHEEALKSYLDTYHGQLAWLGGKEVAKCSDCHRAHDVHKSEDPASKVSPGQREATCRQCHKQASPGLLAFQPHGNTHDFKKYPQLWIIAKVMVVLVVVVLTFFYLHSVLWFRRSWQETGSLRTHHRAPSGEPHFRRFAWHWRVNHWMLALSVMTLVFTGMTAKFAESLWAGAVVQLIAPERLALLHRIAAVVFLGAVIGHTVAVLVRIWRKRRTFRWFGPDSMLPRWKDWHDMVGQFRWFLGKGEKPRLDRFTYWEKFDYWAVYWGAIVIGVSGLILWFSTFFGYFLPGWVFNVATVAHGVEAFLAVTTLFVVHFFNNHFRPGKFPLDTVMFVGSWPLHELKEERPEEYERLVASGELQARLVPPPSRLADLVSHALGFTLISIGILLLVMVVAGFLQKGLV